MSDRAISELENRLYEDLGFKCLSPAWAKAEILLGLAAVSAGHLCGVYAIVHLGGQQFWAFVTASLLLQSLGGYLGLAGHRSHVYQSQNKLAVWLAKRLAEGNRNEQLQTGQLRQQ
jgi:hypothetical protein